jgi:Na+/H+ antiporter NhaD/arsenite permease-like protein
LLSEALLSNTGGVATKVGDPPNILIGSAANLSFGDFLTHSLPVAVVVWLVALFMLRYLFRRDLKIVPEQAEAVLELDPGEVYKDPATAKRVLIVVGAVVLAFLFEEQLHLSTALIAATGAAAAFIWVRPEIRETLKRVEWDVLIFFAGLFVMAGGLEGAGVLSGLAGSIASVRALPPVVLGLAMLWVVALLSAVVDNVPITIALIPVIQGLGANGINIQPLWWALAFGAGFGGNGTIIGSTANVVVTSLSERTRHPITPALWNKRGLPVMLVTCTVASLLYAAAYPLFTR